MSKKDDFGMLYVCVKKNVAVSFKKKTFPFLYVIEI